MMAVNTVTTVLKWLMFAAISFFFVSIGIFVIVAMQRDKDTRAKIDTAIYNASTVAYNANLSFIELNRPKTGLLAQTYGAVHDLRLSIDNVNKAAIDERLFLEKVQPEEVAKLNDLLGKGSTALATLNTTIATSNVFVSNLSQVAIGVKSTIGEATTTLHSAHTLLDNKDVPVIVSNVKQMSEDGKETTGYIKVEAKDTADWWHSFLHPTWTQRLLNGVKNTGIQVAKFFW